MRHDVPVQREPQCRNLFAELLLGQLGQVFRVGEEYGQGVGSLIKKSRRPEGQRAWENCDVHRDVTVVRWPRQLGLTASRTVQSPCAQTSIRNGFNYKSMPLTPILCWLSNGKWHYGGTGSTGAGYVAFVAGKGVPLPKLCLDRGFRG